MGARTFTEPMGDETSAMTPGAFIRRHLDPSARVLREGSATAFYDPPNVAYHTTWDASPLGDAIEAAGGDPAGAIDRLRAQGFTHVLMDFDELDRLIGEGWYDPRVTLADAAEIARAGTIMRSWSNSTGLGTHLIALTFEGSATDP